MATKLISTGVQFPDNTVQTTASSGGTDVVLNASGSISTGDMVSITSVGNTVEKTLGSQGGKTNDDIDSGNIYTGGQNPYVDTNWDSIYSEYHDKVIWVGQRGNSAYLDAKAINIDADGSGNPRVQTVGATHTVLSAAPIFVRVMVNNSDGHIVVVYMTSNKYYAVALTLSGYTFTQGTAVMLWSATLYHDCEVAPMFENNNKFAICTHAYSVGRTYMGIHRISATRTITAGSWAEIGGFAYGDANPYLGYCSNADRLFHIFRDYISPRNHVYQIITPASGTTQTFTVGSKKDFPHQATQHVESFYFGNVRDKKISYDPDNNIFLILYSSNDSAWKRSRAFTVGGSDLTFGDELIWSFTPYGVDNNYYSFNLTYSRNHKKFLFVFDRTSGGTELNINFVDFKVNTSDLSITEGTRYSLDATDMNTNGSGNHYFHKTLILAPQTHNDFVGLFRLHHYSPYYAVMMALNVPTVISKADKFIGVAKENINNGSSGQITVSGTAGGFSGLTIGQTYYLSELGTLTTDTTKFGVVGTAKSATEIVIQRS